MSQANMIAANTVNISGGSFTQANTANDIGGEQSRVLTLLNEKGFSARHEQAYDNQIALTQRLVEGLTKAHREGDIDDEDHETFILLSDEAIEAANDYSKTILDYKQVPTYNIPGKLKKKGQVRKAKRKVRQVNEQLQTHYCSSVSGSDTSSVTAQSGSPPGSGLENEMIRDWTYDVHSSRSRASVDGDDYSLKDDPHWGLSSSQGSDASGIGLLAQTVQALKVRVAENSRVETQLEQISSTRDANNSRKMTFSPGRGSSSIDKVIGYLSPSFFIDLNDDAFQKLCHLGEGAIHKVRHRQSGAIFARKTRPTLDVTRSQLIRELTIAADVDHRNIVKCCGLYMSPSSSEVKILMEYCEGGSLDAVGKQMKRLDAVVGEKIYGCLAEGILQGLNYLHCKNIIHRDIKPQHVLLNREGVIKLCDFSISGELVESYAGTFTGTGVYMAPERISGSEYTISSDVWSTGITLLELVQNRHPFPSDLPPIELLMCIANGDAPRLEDENGRYWSDEMKDFIKQTMNADGLVRPPPKDMLQHVWITTVMRQKPHMSRWIRTVWGWPKPRRSRNESSDAHAKEYI